MVYEFDPGALLGRSYPLEGGVRVFLRVARSSDALAIEHLTEEADGPAGELEVHRLVNFDPRRRCVLCATALLDGGERLIGVGAIELGDSAPHGPERILIHRAAPPGVRPLLAGALTGRAMAVAAARAA